MNLSVFIQSLNAAEQEEVFDLLYSLRHSRTKDKSRSLIMTKGDTVLAKTNKIEAIKSVRNRNRSTLREAKCAVDNYLENIS